MRRNYTGDILYGDFETVRWVAKEKKAYKYLHFQHFRIFVAFSHTTPKKRFFRLFFLDSCCSFATQNLNVFWGKTPVERALENILRQKFSAFVCQKPVGRG